jgi:hypothetical protein
MGSAHYNGKEPDTSGLTCSNPRLPPAAERCKRAQRSRDRRAFALGLTRTTRPKYLASSNRASAFTPGVSSPVPAGSAVDRGLIHLYRMLNRFRAPVNARLHPPTTYWQSTSAVSGPPFLKHYIKPTG